MRSSKHQYFIVVLFLKDHDCQHKPQLCPNEGCGEMISKPEFKTHWTKRCNYRNVTCKHCKEKMIAKDLEVNEQWILMHCSIMSCPLSGSLCEVPGISSEVREMLAICQEKWP